MILATDLDGTFLGGDEQARRQLYRLIQESDSLKLIFVTGRGLEMVVPLLSDRSIPRPDYIIADVGGTVVDARDMRPIQPLQYEIEKIWSGYEPIVAAMAAVPGIQVQEVPQEHRCSFFYDASVDWNRIREIAERHHCDLLTSADRYLDFLPRGVNKGSSLRRLIASVPELAADQGVLAAGDTLNDLELLRAGYPAVAVGNAEAALRAETRGESNIYQARARGAGGILEALAHFGFIENEKVFTGPEPFPAAGSAQVILSYHRLPYEETTGNGVLQRTPPKSPNGIIPTLLNYFISQKPGIWLAADPAAKKREDYQKNVRLDDAQFPALQISRVPLSPKDYDLFYKVFSKEALWPIIFSFPERAKFVDAHWEHFCRINRQFAEQAAEQAQENALVWVHDYNQWMVPAYLRQFRPDLRIAFFHHTAFPAADIFNIIPWSNEIVGSLLKCDYVGFHIPHYIANFVQVARSHAPVVPGNRQSFAPRFMTYGCALGIDESYTEVRQGSHVTRLGAHPVGVNVSNIKTRLASDSIQGKLKTLRRHYEGSKVVLSIERMDYVKGPVQKLHAFEALLEKHPEWHGKVTLVNICPPAAEQMTIYRSVQTQMEQAVGRINGRFSRPGWNPVEFFFRSFAFDEVLAYYALADVCWVTPLRDGLNLVAKEYVAVCDTTHNSGVLVLSEFAGASVELKGALLTNPYHESDLANKLLQALEMSPEEGAARLNKMAATISHYDIARWAEDFLQAASQSQSSAPVPAS